MEKSLFELKPQITVAIIPTIFWSFIISAFIGFFAFGLSHSIPVFLIVFLLLFLGISFLTFMNLRARNYIFYQDKAEFYEGFLNIIQRTVRYDKVTDCILKRSVWDRMFGTGTIRLVTAGHQGVGYGGYGAQIGGGISIQYIENPDDIYKKIEQLLQGH